MLGRRGGATAPELPVHTIVRVEAPVPRLGYLPDTSAGPAPPSTVVADKEASLIPLDQLRALGAPIEWALTQLSTLFASLSVVNGSALGLAIVVVTGVMCLGLFPLYGWQARTARRIQIESRLMAGQVGELRRRYRAEPQKLNEEMMKLYREHGFSPFSNLVGCFPLLLQIPILFALSWGITAATYDIHVGLGFLWVGNVSRSPIAAGLHPTDVVLPLMAALATFAEAKIVLEPPRPNMSIEDLKVYRLSKTMLVLAPGTVLLFGLTLPQGLSIYWLAKTLVTILQRRRAERGGPMRPGGRGPWGGSPGDPSGRPVRPRWPDPSRKASAAEELQQPRYLHQSGDIPVP
jgi:YidC/Oxa1 family membrane protein insertase